MDPLVELNRDKWPLLRDTFKPNCRFGVPGYYLLDTQLSYPDIGSICKFRLFCPYGDMYNGLVAINIKGTFHELIILPYSENTKQIEEALVNTKLIDWNHNMCVPYAETAVLRMLTKLNSRIGLRIQREVPTLKHFLSKNSEPYDLECPPNTYTGPLKLEHIPQVDRAWPHRYDTSYMFFELLINNGLTYGLFSKENDELLAWITVCEAGFLTHLYCEEKHRRKGYAEFVAKYVSNDMLKKGKDLFCYILDNNSRSMHLYKKLRYDVIGRGIWTFITKEGKHSQL